MTPRSVAPGVRGVCDCVPEEGFPGTVTDGRHVWCRVIVPQSAVFFRQKTGNVGLILVCNLVSQLDILFAFCI